MNDLISVQACVDHCISSEGGCLHTAIRLLMCVSNAAFGESGDDPILTQAFSTIRLSLSPEGARELASDLSGWADAADAFASRITVKNDE